VLDWFSLLLLFLLASLIAWRVHLLVSPDTFAPSVRLEYLPIFLFTILAGSIFSYKAAGLRQARERARLELGALIAREMQSPLFAVRTHAVSLNKFLPALVRAPVARHPGADAAPPVAEAQLRALERVPSRIEEAVEQINSIVQTLLPQVGQPASAEADVRAISINQCIDKALARLPLHSDLERSRVILHGESDFRLVGSPALLIHVLARVFEASFTLIYNDTRAKLAMQLGQTGEWNYLCLGDSSAPFRPVTNLLRLGFAHVDKDFSDRPDLAFAKLVMERMGGSLTRTVGLGGTTQIILWFRSLGAP
jgi:hypothetical protein